MNKPRHTRPLLEQALAELNQHYPGPARVPTFAIREIARRTGYSERQIRRVLAHAASQPAAAFEVDQAVITSVFTACGNLAKAHRALQHAGLTVPSLSTFKRHVVKTLGTGQIAYAKRGSQALRNKAVYLTNQYPHRLHSVLLDHTELPIYVIPNGHRIADKPWMTAVMDGKTRYLLGWVITFGRPTSAEVRAALINSIMVGAAPDGHTVIGGRPDTAVWDRGLEFLSNVITESCLRLDITPVALPAYSPHLKGRLERFWNFLKTDALPDLPGYTEGPHDLRGHTALANSAIGEDRFLTLLADWIDQYNTRHVISSEARTPLQMWQEDGYPIEAIAPERLWHDFLQAKDKVKVSTKGVRFDGIDFVAGALHKLVGRHVEVRHLPHDRTFIEVFLDGTHVCTAYPVHALTADQTEEFLAARTREGREAKRRFSTANRLRRKAHDATKLETDKDGKRHVVEQTPSDLLTADVDAALTALLKAGDDEDRLF